MDQPVPGPDRLIAFRGTLREPRRADAQVPALLRDAPARENLQRKLDRNSAAELACLATREGLLET